MSKPWGAVNKMELNDLIANVKGRKRKMLTYLYHNWYQTGLIEDDALWDLEEDLQFSIFKVATTIAGIDVHQAYFYLRDKSPEFKALPEWFPILKVPSFADAYFTAKTKKAYMVFFKDTFRDRDFPATLATLLHEMTHAALAWKGNPNFWKHDRKFISTLKQVYIDVLKVSIKQLTPSLEVIKNQMDAGAIKQQATADAICITAADLIADNIDYWGTVLV